MSQDYAQLYRSIWLDADFRALTVNAQHRYLMLLSHPDRNAAGILSLTPRKWTKLAADLGAAELKGSLAELDDASFIVMDEETEEVLIRSFIRRGNVYTNIRLLAKALREVEAVESERLRSAIGQELMRLPRLKVPESNVRAALEATAAQAKLDDLASMLCDAPPEEPGVFHKGLVEGLAQGVAQGVSQGVGHPHGIGMGTGMGTGTGTAVGSSSSTENESLEVNARTRTRERLCSTHRQPADDCRGCAADAKAAR